MAKKRKRRVKKTNSVPSVQLSDERYQKLLFKLLEARQASLEGQACYWDLGPGERPQKISAEFLYVAKREEIYLKIERSGRSLILLFPKEKLNKTRLKVVRDGQIIISEKFVN